MLNGRGYVTFEHSRLEQNLPNRLISLYASITVFRAASVAQKSVILKLSAAKSYFHSLIRFSQLARPR